MVLWKSGIIKKEKDFHYLVLQGLRIFNEINYVLCDSCKGDVQNDIVLLDLRLSASFKTIFKMLSYNSGLWKATKDHSEKPSSEPKSNPCLFIAKQVC